MRISLSPCWPLPDLDSQSDLEIIRAIIAPFSGHVMGDVMKIIGEAWHRAQALLSVGDYCAVHSAAYSRGFLELDNEQLRRGAGKALHRSTPRITPHPSRLTVLCPLVSPSTTFPRHHNTPHPHLPLAVGDYLPISRRPHIHLHPRIPLRSTITSHRLQYRTWTTTNARQPSTNERRFVPQTEVCAAVVMNLCHCSDWTYFGHHARNLTQRSPTPAITLPNSSIDARCLPGCTKRHAPGRGPQFWDFPTSYPNRSAVKPVPLWADPSHRLNSGKAVSQCKSLP
ncbi:hypothetical protein DL98DRAFT_45450 [Cadophora sp. DSE1049]|nr:hypothetical protein DL98DRAFT_45450 [Cadophora sp. DSE1049]